MEIDKRFTSRNRAPVALTCSLINLEVAPSTVETSTYLQISIQSKRLDTLWPARCGKFQIRTSCTNQNLFMLTKVN